MTTKYEPSMRPSGYGARKGPAAPQGARNPLAESRPGDRCPRPGCGGLVMVRTVVTVVGSCDEVFCSLCARSALSRYLEPYVPLKRARDSQVDALLTPPTTRDSGLESDDSMGIAMPPAVRAVVLHDTPLSSECPPGGQPDEY